MPFNPTRRKQVPDKSKREEELETELLLKKIETRGLKERTEILQKEIENLRHQYPKIIRIAFIVGMIFGIIFGMIIGGKIF